MLVYLTGRHCDTMVITTKKKASGSDLDFNDVWYVIYFLGDLGLVA